MSGQVGLLGDSTDHGGKIIKVSGNFPIDGVLNARQGDWVSCPKHGDNQIVDGSTFMDNGLGVVVYGCKSQCGSTILATGRALINT